MLTRRTVALAALLASLAPFSAARAEDQIYTPRFSNQAVSGYDAVAYFKDGAPTKGDKKFAMDYQGATWLFSSQENLDAFRADPQAYAPQYGGYCAWAVSQDYTARGNPQNWSIVNGKLYLNYNDKIQARWEKDIPGFITLADKNWPAVLDK